MNTKALYNISYGLYIISSRKGDIINGQIANTVIQVCSEPVIISVAINKNNFTHECISSCKIFTASILSKDTQISFIGSFGFKSGREINKFDGINYKLTTSAIPVVLDNTLAYIEAKVFNQVDVKTHTIFIGEVVDADVLREGGPMTYYYYQQVKRGTTPKSAPSYIKKKEEKPVGAKYKCNICGYIYDPSLGDSDGGIKPGTQFEELPSNWLCPVCGASKSEFEKIG